MMARRLRDEGGDPLLGVVPLDGCASRDASRPGLVGVIDDKPHLFGGVLMDGSAHTSPAW
jgi:hypothetical protein